MGVIWGVIFTHLKQRNVIERLERLLLGLLSLLVGLLLSTLARIAPRSTRGSESFIQDRRFGRWPIEEQESNPMKETDIEKALTNNLCSRQGIKT